MLLYQLLETITKEDQKQSGTHGKRHEFYRQADLASSLAPSLTSIYLISIHFLRFLFMHTYHHLTHYILTFIFFSHVCLQYKGFKGWDFILFTTASLSV